MKRTLFILPLLLLGLAPAGAYVPQIDFNEFGRIVRVKWPASSVRDGVAFSVNVKSFPFDSQAVLRIVRDSFGAWEGVATSDLSFVDEGTGSFVKSSTDRRNTILFDATGFDIGAPRGSGIIAITTINWDSFGNITDTDITFNGRDFNFSVSEVINTRGGVVDLQDTMTHEIGHLLGLDHTPLDGISTIRPTMHPFASPEGTGRTLASDDIAAMTHLYPGLRASETGTLTGQVFRANGDAAFGVHVVAHSRTTGLPVASSLSGSAGDNRGRGGDGRYEIQGLPPGDYHLSIAPVSGSVSEENLGGIFSNLEHGFPVEFYDNVSTLDGSRVVRVGAGRVAAGIDFTIGLTIPGFPLLVEQALPVNTPDVRGPYLVQMKVTDNDGIVSAEVSCQVNGSGAFMTSPLQHTGGDIWEGHLGAQPPGTTLSYRVRATDAVGNTSSFPAESEPAREFTVLDMSGAPVFYVVQSGSGLISVVDSGTGSEVARIPTGDTPHSLAMTPNEEVLFVANTGTPDQSGRTLTAIETATHRTLAQIDVGFGPLDLAVDAAGKTLFVTNSDARSLSVVDVLTLREVKRINLTAVVDGPFGVATRADGDTAYVTDIDGNQVLVIDVASASVTSIIPVLSSPRSLAISNDGGLLFVSGFDGGVGVIDLERGQQVRTVSTEGGIFRLAASPTSDRIYATSHENGNLLVIDPIAGLVSQTLPVLSTGQNTRGLTVSKDGSRIYVANQDSNDLVVFDAQTLSVIQTYRIGDGPRGIGVRITPFLEPFQTDEIAQADFDGDLLIGFSDFVLFAAGFGSIDGQPSFESRFDLDGDGQIGFADFLRFAELFGRRVA
ncbi:MAG: hypothetical protein CME26_01405 [Gemmatimonadetes bacterium]|nr:hypothetical protein [Gemmatimonadota bacterium]